MNKVQRMVEQAKLQDMVEPVLQEMRQEHSKQRNICYTFAMDALQLEHYDLLNKINRQAHDHHSLVMATFEVWERLEK